MELLKKLNHPAKMAIWIVNAPESFLPALHEMQETAEMHTDLPDGERIPFLLAFVEQRTDLESIAKRLQKTVSDSTVLWFAYPKKSSKRYRSDIDRDHGWEALGLLGLEPVRQIAIDEDWSALRFKPVGTIKRLTRSASMTLSEEAQTRLKEKG